MDCQQPFQILQHTQIFLPQIFSRSILPLTSKSPPSAHAEKSSALIRSFRAGNSWTLSLRSSARFPTLEPLSSSSGIEYWILLGDCSRNNDSRKRNSTWLFIVSAFLKLLSISWTLWEAALQDVSGMFKQSTQHPGLLRIWGYDLQEVRLHSDVYRTKQERKHCRPLLHNWKCLSSLWSTAAPGRLPEETAYYPTTCSSKFKLLNLLIYILCFFFYFLERTNYSKFPSNLDFHLKCCHHFILLFFIKDVP